MKSGSIKNMSFGELLKLRASVNQPMARLLNAAHDALQRKLAGLDNHPEEVPEPFKYRAIGPNKGKKIEPEYVGPKGETWAGRGLRPRWLMKLIIQGRKLEEFAVGGKASKKRRRKRSYRRILVTSVVRQQRFELLI